MMDDDIKNILARSDVFGSMPEADLERLTSCLDEWKTLAGDILATADEPAWYFFILKEGSLLLELKNNKAVVLSTPGDFIGFELISSKDFYSATLWALENGYVLVLPEQKMLDLIQEDSPAADHIIQAWEGYLEKTAPFLIKN